jgi:putative tryptophan/tyrosine transport system substrate-binding protein
MRRRHFIALLGIAAARPFAVRAQEAKARRVGVLVTSSVSDPGNVRSWQAFENDLRERGWEEGRNIAFERRSAGSDPARFPELAAELVALKVDWTYPGLVDR